ncbi:hypothetical protein GCM10020331_035140 [Ectobacillus funiculus]
MQAHRLTLLTSGACFLGLTVAALLWNASNVTMWIVVIFLAVSLYLEWKQRQYIFVRFFIRALLWEKNGILKKLTLINANANDPLYTVFMQFRRGYKHSVVIKGKERQQYTLDENELLYAYFTEKRISSSIGELIS